ncbi:hypothetical protein KP509_06G010200 [Ceratopteris richardii]|uniref:Cytochrome P450 n=1 Tax=Ceratopteris richardii TaxID=49495 RepID=A0A8T2UIF2_CERRI|nr:hypothetical protein KP509_06G010200 [Ceratopteris richardii]
MEVFSYLTSILCFGDSRRPCRFIFFTNTMQWHPVLWTAASLIFCSSLFLWFNRNRAGKEKGGRFPPGPRPWPLLGNLPVLNGNCLHRVLFNLACGKNGYGPLMGLRLGSRLAVVASDAYYAREILSTHDRIFATRPHFAFADTIFYGYNSAVIFSSYNPKWARLRKIYTLELFTAKRLRELEFVRQEEVKDLIDRLQEESAAGTKEVDVGKAVSDMTANTTSRLVFSRKAEQFDLAGLVQELEDETTVILRDFIPRLAFLDIKKMSRMKRLHDRIDAFLNPILAARRQLLRSLPPSELPHDFLQVLLSKESCENEDERLTSHEIKGMLLDILSAGVQTSAVASEWAITELIRNPLCLRKLQEEIDSMKKDMITDNDTSQMPYLQDVVKEVFRLHAPAPLLVPRVSTEECRIGDYLLPKGTLAFVNTFAIGRNEVHWERPEEFRPERYTQHRLDPDGGQMKQNKMTVDIHGQHYELVPFGSGRRMCAGIRLGLSMVTVTLANLVRFFDWELPKGISPDAIDMAEKGAISTSKATPLLAIPKRR